MMSEYGMKTTQYAEAAYEDASIREDGSINEYDGLLDAFEKALGRLEDRVGPVLGSELASEARSLDKISSTRMRGQNDRLRRLVQSLSDLTDRIDL